MRKKCSVFCDKNNAYVFEENKMTLSSPKNYFFKTLRRNLDDISSDKDVVVSVIKKLDGRYKFLIKDKEDIVSINNVSDERIIKKFKSVADINVNMYKRISKCVLAAVGTLMIVGHISKYAPTVADYLKTTEATHKQLSEDFETMERINRNIPAASASNAQLNQMYDIAEHYLEMIEAGEINLTEEDVALLKYYQRQATENEDYIFEARMRYESEKHKTR